MLGWETGPGTQREGRKDCKSRRLFKREKRERRREREQDKERWEELIYKQQAGIE